MICFTIRLQLVLITIFYLSACTLNGNDSRRVQNNPDYLHRSVRQVTGVMLHDIYSPPVASRIYAYITVAGYEAALHADRNYRSLAGQLHGLESLPQPDKTKVYDFSIASAAAVLHTGRSLVASESSIDRFQSQLLNEYRQAGVPDDVIDNSIDFGRRVADRILKWAAADRYKQTRSLSKYSVLTDEASWKPTPPAYMKAVEPHWGQLRTFAIDSAGEFRPKQPPGFSSTPSSTFFRLAKEVEQAGLHLTDSQKNIASFWDCNPFKVVTHGHIMYAVKKISPGGHWINIAALAARKVHAPLAAAAASYALVGVTIADGFISCWEEKFRSNVIRPETYINQYMNPGWTPLLQTPPFPEYTSGHSVVSMASAVMLSHLYGENFAFVDSSETEFGIAPRKFASFRLAAAEAAQSRFYGGIHYMPSIRNGILEGEQIGNLTASRIKTRN